MRNLIEPPFEHPEQQLSRRTFLVIQSMQQGSSMWLAMEAVSSTAMAHPEWDLEEKKSWTDWEREYSS